MKKRIFSKVDIGGLILLAALVFSIFLLPVLPLAWQAQSSRIVYTILYFSAVLSLEKRVKFLLAISIFAVCLEWLAGIFSLWLLVTTSKILNAVFFLFIVGSLIYQVATSKEVNLKVILGSIIGYLMLGLVYSIFIAIIIQQDPAAFNIPGSPDKEATTITHLGESIYFSFVSLATVGYGDIVAIKPYTRSLSIWISISGQLYIAIIIALLVGKISSGRREATTDN